MEIRITRKQALQIGFDKFEQFGYREHSWGWRGNKAVSFDLSRFTPDQVSIFKTLLTNAKGVYGMRTNVRDFALWEAAASPSADLSTDKVASIQSFTQMLTEFMRKVPEHRLYKRDTKLDAWLAYHVKKIVFRPKRITNGWFGKEVIPPHVEMTLQYEHGTLGAVDSSVTFWANDVVGDTVAETLRNKDWYPETDELRKRYDKTTKKFKKWFKAIGKQFLANGTASFQETSDNAWWRKQTVTFKLDNARVVIDVLKEGDAGEDEDDSDDDDARGTSSFWFHLVKNDEGKTETVGEPVVLPIHPYLRVFHLSKHMQLTLHISALTRYKYDPQMIDKLVIDDTRKSLVKLLIDHRSSTYQDIIGAKSGGAIVMLCGSPGTGKTLTAEVFAESEQRALYSVQCAQLGTSPEALENELLKVLARAQRWKAVLLLDEADVYVYKRGKDVQQNAMVGVFLRVLEYQNAVMFMTTNRAKDIDDAVASRCTARLVYAPPTVEEQARIWRVLVDTASAKMTDAEIAKVAEANPKLSGRDVKNLLKLAMLVCEVDKPITAKTIEFVKQFKPTS